jgi:hypothetical protein
MPYARAHSAMHARAHTQLGYIVALFSNQELGVHHLELLVQVCDIVGVVVVLVCDCWCVTKCVQSSPQQLLLSSNKHLIVLPLQSPLPHPPCAHARHHAQSNAYAPCDLLARMDTFVEQLISQLLPGKCGATRAPPATAPGVTPGASATPNTDTTALVADDTRTGETGAPAEGEKAAAAAGDNACAAGLSEFEEGVSELRASLLEKPKRLGELAGRWWSEVGDGCVVQEMGGGGGQGAACDAVRYGLEPLVFTHSEY